MVLCSAAPRTSLAHSWPFSRRVCQSLKADLGSASIEVPSDDWNNEDDDDSVDREVTLHILFDNSYSWFTPKTLRYFKFIYVFVMANPQVTFYCQRYSVCAQEEKRHSQVPTVSTSSSSSDLAVVSAQNGAPSRVGAGQQQAAVELRAADLMCHTCFDDASAVFKFSKQCQDVADTRLSDIRRYVYAFDN